MATLNIKGFPDELYDRLREDAEREHRSVAKHATYLLERAIRRRSFSLERLRGLGNEMRADDDPAEQACRKRESGGDGE